MKTEFSHPAWKKYELEAKEASFGKIFKKKY